MTARLPILNDPAAVEVLVRDNLRLVTHIACQYRSTLGLEELIAEGTLGLVMAARVFDVKRKVKFSTYASWWINAKIKLRIARESGCYHTNDQRKLLWGIRKAFAACADDTGRASPQAVADFLGISVACVEAFARHLIQGEVRLDAKAYDDGDESVGARMLVEARTAEDDVADAEEKQRVRDAMRALSPRERFVIGRRFAEDPEFLEDVGKQLGGISRERVRQIEKNALAKMRRALEAA